jgi:hypothetical protein
MTQSALHIQRVLLYSLEKLENSNYLTPEEIRWLHGSVMCLVAEISVLQDAREEPESSEPQVA